jgi:hypothetical protein
MDIKQVADVMAIVAALAAIGGGCVALATYRDTLKLRRAEWIEKLHAKFYESSTYKRIRWVLDYRPTPEYENLRKGISDQQSDDELCESFVDYLNFFEYIASLWELKQLSLAEVLMLFEYYLQLMNQEDFAVEFVEKQGFENLKKLLKCVPPKPSSRGTTTT